MPTCHMQLQRRIPKLTTKFNENSTTKISSDQQDDKTDMKPNTHDINTAVQSAKSHQRLPQLYTTQKHMLSSRQIQHQHLCQG